MGLKPIYHQAVRIRDSLTPMEQQTLRGICKEIQAAEKALDHASRHLMQRCIHQCKGICCRNIHLDAVIDLRDFVFIMTLHPSLSGTISDCLADERLLFPSDCVFLKDGIGPCIFPDNAKPFVCISTFCEDESTVRNEIRLLRRKFNQLSLFLFARKIRSGGRFFRNVIRCGRS